MRRVSIYVCILVMFLIILTIARRLLIIFIFISIVYLYSSIRRVITKIEVMLGSSENGEEHLHLFQYGELKEKSFESQDQESNHDCNKLKY